MQTAIDIVLQAGHSAIEVSLYTLLPIMVVMTILLRIFEVTGILGWVMRWAAPVATPFGLTGLGIVAMVQISLVSFVAPLPTLSLMEDRGTSDRRLCATFAAVLAMAPANATFPLAVLGLDVEKTLMISVLGGLAAASSVYWLFGRRLSNTPRQIMAVEKELFKSPSLLKIVNASGAEAIRIVMSIIPMLLMSLVVVNALQRTGVIAAFVYGLAPGLRLLSIQPGFVLPALTKYLAGSTALVGITHDLAGQGRLDPSVMSLAGAGFLLHPLDLPGLAILVSAGPRLAKTSLVAVAGGCAGIALRVMLGVLLG
jgi:spore maturation protein SpmB